tara:strand:- start:153 stop:683 length:531 start_codon:yes stop_codon:yes gene_type:complete
MIAEGKNDLESDPILIVVFRGTGRSWEWRMNLDFFLTPWDRAQSMVHRGFKKRLELVWDKVNRFLDETKHSFIFYGGHSQGAAVATLASSTRPPGALYTFGCPRVGDDRFVKSLANITVFRIVNCLDLVTRVPFEMGSSFQYRHVGEIYYINRDGVLNRSSETDISKDRVECGNSS